ncbi:hypothetical protein ISCGN_030686 [Ixodes scapularis]
MSFRPPHPGDFGGPSFYAPQMYPYRPYYAPPGLAPVANLGYTGGSPMTYNFQPFPPRRSASLPRPPPSVDDQRSVRKPSKPRKPHKSLKLPCGRKVDITKKNLYIKQWRDKKLPFNWACCWVLALLILLIVFLLITINHQDWLWSLFEYSNLDTTEEHSTRNATFDVTNKSTQEVSEWNVSLAFITTTPQ